MVLQGVANALEYVLSTTFWYCGYTLMQFVKWFFVHRTKGRHKQRYCPQFYVQGTAKHGSHIRKKHSQRQDVLFWMLMARTHTSQTRVNRHTLPRDHALQAHFDSRSFPIRLDSHSSFCLSPFKTDFIADLMSIQVNIRGLDRLVQLFTTRAQ